MKITRTIYGQEITIELTNEELREAHQEAEKNYLREDVLQWAEDHGKTVGDELLENIVKRLNDDYDSDYSLWDNISANYNWFVYLRNK